MSQDERTTSAGLWRFSNEFFSAAATLANDRGDKFFTPIYFLHGRSIELALKSFLRARGTPYKELRFAPYGHDLSNLLKESRRRRLGAFVKLSHADCAAVSLLNREYASKRFEYIVTGSMTVPKLLVLQLVNASLVSGLRTYCLQDALRARS